MAARAAELRTEGERKKVRARCKTFAGFVKEAWRVIEPSQDLIWNWHLDALCQHLEAITFGKITRLLATVPPGSSKSIIVSVLWQAWEWGPCGLRSLRYLATAFNDGPVKRDTRKCRDLMLSDWYQALWPEVALTRTGETSFANSSTGTREGLAFGSLTSQRGDRLLIDDPHSTETAESPAERATTTRKFREGAINRLNDQKRSAIVVIMQRLHTEDIAGVILKLGMDFVHLCLPMEFEPERRCITSIGFKDPRTQKGELLDPVRFPREVVEKLKRDMGSYAYAGQYQQRPAPREGGMFKSHWFNIVRAVPAGAAARVRRWDLAATIPTAGRDPDWTVGVKMARVNGRYYVEDVKRFRERGVEVRRAIKAAAVADGREVPIVLPKDPGQAGKEQAESMVGELAGFVARAKPESGSKEVRAEPFAAQCEAGNVFLVAADWNSVFVDELCTFPMGHDDQVDASAGAFNELTDDGTTGIKLDAAAFHRANPWGTGGDSGSED